METRSLIISFFILLTCQVYAQTNNQLLSGQVTYVTSNNAYVHSDDLEFFQVGDTLMFYTNAGMSPCLVIDQKSSSSCVCTILNNCGIKKDDKVFFMYTYAVGGEKKVKEPLNKIEERITDEIVEEIVLPEEEMSDIEREIRNEKSISESDFKQKVNGRITAASYSSLSPKDDNRHRMMMRFSFNAQHINDSKFSFESYLNYRQNIIQNSESSVGSRKFFRVYNLAVRYDLNPTTILTFGRRINNKASSLGAIDGLQAEKIFGNNYVGVIGGFRPDIVEFDFNPNLLEYGGYVGRKTNAKNMYAQTTLGLLEQRNNGNVDRRYTYFQHSSTLFKKLSLFGSLEMDLYTKVNEVVSNKPRLTNLFVSARYRFSRKLDFMVSYDSRKRVLFYETFKTEIERLLDDDEARQGIRARVNVKPHKYITVGASYGKRFQSDQQNKSDNINGFFNLSKVPKIDGRFSFNFNMNTSSYLESQISSFRYSRYVLKRKLNVDLYFRMVNYVYLNSEVTFGQNYYGSNLSYRFSKKWSISLLGEMSAARGEKNFRVNTKVANRFGK